MTTPRNLIKTTLKKMGIIAIGETPNYEEENDAFEELNRMISNWNTKNLLVFGITIESFSTVAAQGSYTLGSGGDWDTTVPVRTDAAYLKYDTNVELPMKIVDNKYWGRLIAKDTETTFPFIMYIDNNHPLKTVYIFPTPSEVKTIKLHNYRQLSAFSSLTETIALKTGYEDAMIYNLYIRLAPDYGKAIPPEIVKLAGDTLGDIKRVNIRPVEIGVDSALIKGIGFDYRTGEPT